MEGSDWEDEEQYPAAPLPAHERSWRHPSELGQVQLARNEPPLALGRGLMIATGAIGGLLAIAVLWAMLPASADAPAASATVSRLTAQEVVRTVRSSTTTRSSISNAVTTQPARSSVASSLASTLASTTSARPPAPTEPAATIRLVGTDTAAALSNAVALAGSGLLVTTAKAIGDERTVTVTMGDESMEAQVVVLDAVSGVAVLEPVGDSGAKPFEVAGCAPGDHVRVLGDTPFEADVSEGDGGHFTLSADGEALEGTPIVDDRGHLVGLYSSTARGTELLRLDRVSTVAPGTTSTSSTSTTAAPTSSDAATVAPSSSGATTTAVATVDSSAASTTTLRAMPVWLGVQADDAGGALSVTAVADGGPASTAGVAVGDVITALAGVAVSDRADVASVLAARAPGDTISVTVLRAGVRHNLSVVLAPRPSL